MRVAVERGHLGVVERLLEAGFKVFVKLIAYNERPAPRADSSCVDSRTKL